MLELLNNLREIVDMKIRTCEDANLEKYKLIQDILKEDNCFFRIDRTTAYAILEDLDILEKDIPIIYNKLISQEMYLETNKKYAVE